MSRPAVFADKLATPEVAAALREHRADREALLASLTDWLQAQPSVRAAWLWGSFGRGEADDLSDLDVWIVVTDTPAGTMGRHLRSFAEQTGNFLTGGEAPQNGPPGGGYFGTLLEGRHGLLHLDCYWQPESAAEIPEQALLFLRREALPVPHAESPMLPQPTNALTPEEDRIVDGIAFAWQMLSIAAKTLARYPDSDMGLMMYPRSGLEDAAALLGQEGLLKPSDWSVPEDTIGKVSLLRSVANKTAQLTEAANARGLTLPLRADACLSRYLHMVEGILSCRSAYL